MKAFIKKQKENRNFLQNSWKAFGATPILGKKRVICLGNRPRLLPLKSRKSKINVIYTVYPTGFTLPGLLVELLLTFVWFYWCQFYLEFSLEFSTYFILHISYSNFGNLFWKYYRPIYDGYVRPSCLLVLYFVFMWTPSFPSFFLYKVLFRKMRKNQYPNAVSELK